MGGKPVPIQEAPPAEDKKKPRAKGGFFGEGTVQSAFGGQQENSRRSTFLGGF